MVNYRIISSDDHVYEPPDLWTNRIDSKYKDRAPVIVRQEDGSDWWICEDQLTMTMTAGSETGVRLEKPETLSLRDVFENVRPGGYDPDERLKDMDLDGVDATVMYPTVGLRMVGLVEDGGLLSAIWRAYNDWLAEFCSAHPKRLKGIASINLDDVQDGLAELERCAKLGLIGAMIPAYPPEDRPYDLPEYEPFWAAAEDLQIPLSLHIGTNRNHILGTSATISAAQNCTIAHWVQVSVAQMIYNGVFERHPKLMVGVIEGELGWAPHFIDRLDYQYTQRAKRDAWHIFQEDMLPSQYFHRNIFLSFQEDALGIRLRDILGVDKLQWGSDYPHHESTWPKSQQILEEILADCTEDEKAKIAGGNVSKLYGLG